MSGTYTLKPHGADQLMAKVFPEMEWILPKIIPAAGATLLGGRGKFGKSCLMLDICLAVAGGGNALQSIQVQQRDVLYLALEDHERRLQGRIDKQLALGGNRPPWLSRFRYVTANDRLPRWDRGGKGAVVAYLEKHKPGLAVVDTYGKFRATRKPSADLYQSDYDMANDLAETAAATDTALVVLHHLNQGTNHEDWTSSFSGSEGLVGGFNTLIAGKRPRNQAEGKLYVTGHDVAEREIPVRFDEETLRWALLDAASPVSTTPERTDYLGALAGLGGRAKTESIAKAAGKEVKATSKAMRLLLDAGEVINPKFGVYAIPDPYKNEGQIAN